MKCPPLCPCHSFSKVDDLDFPLETPVTRDAGSTCQCDNNELTEAKLRIDIYREAWREAEKGKILLLEENEGLKEKILDLEQSNRDLKGVMNSIRHWLDKSITHIDDWSENE
jgi:hypothetical protein